MEKLENYIAFDLEFNTVDGESHIIQVSAVKFETGSQVDSFDSYVYTDVPLKSFINGLTGITSQQIAQAPKLEDVLTAFRDFVGETALIGYNALKSDLPLLLAKGLDLTYLYRVDVYEEAFARRSNDLNGIRNLQLRTVAQFLDISGKSHNSLEDARMTALVYEKFLEFDENRTLLSQQEKQVHNPFGGLDLSGFLND